MIFKRDSWFSGIKNFPMWRLCEPKFNCGNMKAMKKFLVLAPTKNSARIEMENLNFVENDLQNSGKEIGL